MMAKRVRFKNSETEPKHSASCRFDACSGPCEAIRDLPMPPAASNEPKTSEFAFFKRLKQDVGHAAHRNPLHSKSFRVSKYGPSNHARELGHSKLEDIKFAKKSPRHPSLEHSAIPFEEDDNGRVKCSSVFKTPTKISLDSFLTSTAHASAKLESRDKEEDIFSSKRLNLLKQIAKTLFPEAGEVPTECNLVSLLLSRLLPEHCQETLLQNLLLRQPEAEENRQSLLDSNIQLKETVDTSRKLVIYEEDNFVDSGAYAGQFRRYWETLPSGQTVEHDDGSADRFSNRMFFEHKEGDQGRSSAGNLLTWGDEICDYSTPGSTSPEILKNGAYMKFPYDTCGNSRSCKLRDHSHSYDILNKSYDSFTDAKGSGLLYEDEIHEFNLDRRAQLSPSSWYDSPSHVSFRRFRAALSYLRDSTEPKYLNDFEIRKEPSPLLLGWDPDKLDLNDSTDTCHMELEIYCPALSTGSGDHWDSRELEVYRPSTQHEDQWVSLENDTLMPFSRYSSQGHQLQEKDLVPGSPRVPCMLSYSPEELDGDDSGLLKNKSKSSSFFVIPQESYSSSENMKCERNYSGVEALHFPQDCESDSELQCKLLIDFLKDQYEISTDNVVELFGRENSSSKFLFDSDNNLALSDSHDRFLSNEYIRLGAENSFPLLLDTVNWKETEAQTYDEDKGTTTFW